MAKLDVLEEQVAALSNDELVSFREWFAAFDADAWDRQLEGDVDTGKLDRMAEQALASLAAGATTRL